MSKVVNVTLTEEEYKFVEKAAEEKGLTISQYVKRFPIGDDEFSRHYEFLLEKVNEQDPDVPFTVMSIFGKNWEKIDKGIRLSLGRNFFHLVKRSLKGNGDLKNIHPAGKNIYNVQLYVRKEKNDKEDIS